MSKFADLKVGDKIEFDNGLVNKKTKATITEAHYNENFVGEKRRYLVETEEGYHHMVKPSEVIKCVG
mgnify:CR=1 FL=1